MKRIIDEKTSDCMNASKQPEPMNANMRAWLKRQCDALRIQLHHVNPDEAIGKVIISLRFDSEKESRLFGDILEEMFWDDSWANVRHAWVGTHQPFKDVVDETNPEAAIVPALARISEVEIDPELDSMPLGHSVALATKDWRTMFAVVNMAADFLEKPEIQSLLQPQFDRRLRTLAQEIATQEARGSVDRG